MKTALLLTNSAETQRLFTEILGERTNFVLVPAPTEPSREKFDVLFTTWLRLVDAVILDAVSLGQTTRWAVESLNDARVQEHQAVVVRTTVNQRTLYPMGESWLIVSDADVQEQLRQSLGTFFELRDAQAKLKHADAVIARQRQAAPTPRPRVAAVAASVATMAAPSFDAHRYRDALKNLSRLLGQHLDERNLLADFVRLVRELLGVGKLALFTRGFPSDLFSEELMPASEQLSAAASIGVGAHVVKHLRLTADAGIGGFLGREPRILHRSLLLDPTMSGYDPQVEREFDVLGTEVAVPMFDDDQLAGVLTFSGKITGEPVTSEELELVYDLMTQLAQALRNLHLRDKIAGQQRFMTEVLAHVQSGVVVVGEGNRILCVNDQARMLLELSGETLVGQLATRLPSRVADVVFEALQTGRELRGREVVLPRNNRPLNISATRFAVSARLAGTESGADSFVALAMIEDLTQVKLQQAQARALADREFFTRLSARLSHELKNSLVSIKIFAQLLPERYTEKEFREQFSTVVTNEVNRVDGLVNNLTFFSHPLALVHEELVLSDVIDVCVANVAQESTRKKWAQVVTVGEKTTEPPPGVPVVTVKKTFAHKLARLEGDKIRLQQAWEHVLRNALQSMPAGGRLAISTADAQPSDYPDGKLPAGGAVRIEFQDTGEGIALEDLKRVMDPFVTTRTIGVGLGLTIVKKIVERHGGRLEIDSLLGRGTTVTMVLPVKAQPHTEDALVRRIEQGEAEEDGAGATHRAPHGWQQEHGGSF